MYDTERIARFSGHRTTSPPQQMEVDMSGVNFNVTVAAKPSGSTGHWQWLEGFTLGVGEVATITPSPTDKWTVIGGRPCTAAGDGTQAGDHYMFHPRGVDERCLLVKDSAGNIQACTWHGTAPSPMQVAVAGPVFFISNDCPDDPDDSGTDFQGYNDNSGQINVSVSIQK
jgi:hypothetical protein